MRRGWLGAGSALSSLAAKVGLAQQAADTAEATGQNARGMVLNDRKRIATLEDVAAEFDTRTAQADAEHARLQREIDDAESRVGPAGPQGERGPAGADGTPGRDGAPGERGPKGETGAAGAQGSAGDRGPAGAKGDTGPAGATGPTGAQGTAGVKGDTGATGPKGDRGDTGPAGASGQTGPQGPAGKDGTNASGVTQVEYRDGIAVPAVLSLLGISATVDVTVTWATPFPDATYVIVKPQTSPVQAALIGKTDAVVKSKTTTGCVITVTTTALLALGNVTLSVLAYRKA